MNALRGRLRAVFGIVLLGIVAVFAVAILTRDSAPAVKVDDAPVAQSVMDALKLIAKLETCGVDKSNVVGRVFDARGKTAADFRKALESLPGVSRRVWMPGADRWFLVGHLTTNRVSLAAAMEAFSALQTAKFSLPELFAAYAGSVDDMMPAFSSDLKGDVLPEWFITKDVPSVEWLDTKGVDADIVESTLSEMRSMQVVRREILKGNMAARAAKGIKEERAAVEIWARSFLRNPRDPFLLERIERLERNARGFLEVGKVIQAMKCYETIILIQPTNVAAIHNFGLCLKRIGKADMAKQVLDRAKVLSKRVNKDEQ